MPTRHANPAAHRGPQPSIAVVGGGIAGLAFAVALGRRGLACRVYERAPALVEIGAGLLLSPNAVAVLDALGLRGALRARAVVTPEWRILDDAGRTLQRLRPFAADRQAISITRSALQHALAAAVAEGSLGLGHETVEVRPGPDGVGIRFRDQRAVTADVVVAADGAASRIRQAIWPRRRLRDAGYVGWRALVDGVPDGWEDGRVTETWGNGRRFGIAAVGGGRTYWYASANNELAGYDQPGARGQSLSALFRGWHAPVADLIAAAPEAAILRHAIHDVVPAGAWHSGGRVVLIGDAAHPLTPNLGQGAAMALEDAWTLAECLAVDRPVAASLAAFERLRRLRLAVVWGASRLLGSAIQATAPGPVMLRRWLLCGTPDGLASAAIERLLRFAPT